MSNVVRIPLMSGGGMDVVDQDGNPVSLTAVIDGEGKAVLRMVDAAPAGYDDELKAIRVVVLGDAESKENRFEQVFSEIVVPANDYIKFHKIQTSGREMAVAVRWEGSFTEWKVGLRHYTAGAVDTLIREDSIFEDGVNTGLEKVEVMTPRLDIRIYNNSEEEQTLRVCEIMFIE